MLGNDPKTLRDWAPDLKNTPGGISGKNIYPGGKPRRGGGGLFFFEENDSPSGKSEKSCFQAEKVLVWGSGGVYSVCAWP